MKAKGTVNNEQLAADWALLADAARLPVAVKPDGMTRREYIVESQNLAVFHQRVAELSNNRAALVEFLETQTLVR